MRGTLLVVLFSMVSIQAAIASDGAPQGDLKQQGYLYGGPLGTVTYGGALLEFGGGFDYLVYKGLGLGASLGIAGGQAGAAVFPAFDVSYHFIPKSRSPLRHGRRWRHRHRRRF